MVKATTLSGKCRAAVWLWAWLGLGLVHAQQATVEYDMALELLPDRRHLDVKATIQFPRQDEPVEILLNRTLSIKSSSVKYTKVSVKPYNNAVRYQLKLEKDKPVVMHYRGHMDSLSAKGVFLDGDNYWYPRVPGKPVSFKLQAELPRGWHLVSQGKKTEQGWAESQPQRDIIIVSGPYYRFTRPKGDINVEVWLLENDKKVAAGYLGVTQRYVSAYEELIGPYPYAKFFMVENRWSTGFGFPSFTLLGSKVIRLPFIKYTSYPHEILHNWWGNSVYVDYDKGNWSEGLTAYLADHLMKEQRGQGWLYRRDTLQKYTDFVKGNNDFALIDFTQRKDESSQAVGYGKSLMVFHMLRRRGGDDAFKQYLQLLYRQGKFKTLGFEQVLDYYTDVSGDDLQGFKKQWLQRVGAPLPELQKAQAVKSQKGYQLQLQMHQLQDGDPYDLKIPVWIYLKEKVLPWVGEIHLTQKQQTFNLPLEGTPVRVEVDPRYDVFRKMHIDEIPPALSQLYGANHAHVVLPADANRDLLNTYLMFADAWQVRRRQMLTVHYDNKIDALPEGPVWIMGRENRFFRENKLQTLPVHYKDHQLVLNGKKYDAGHSWMLCARRESGQPVVYMHMGDVQAAFGLLRKLPHYSKQSYLVFKGGEPEKIVEGQWPVTSSPMKAWLVDDMPKRKFQPPKAQALTKIRFR